MVLYSGDTPHIVKNSLLQKRAVRLTKGHGNRTSFRNFFKHLNILPLKSKYMFSILLFVIKNRNLFTTNSDNHTIKTRQSDNLYLPSSSLSIHQNGAHLIGIKTFNKFSLELKQLVEFPTKFKGTLRRYLVSQSFYSLDEFYSMK